MRPSLQVEQRWNFEKKFNETKNITDSPSSEEAIFREISDWFNAKDV